MKQWLKDYKDWQSRRKVRSLVQWERTRAKGKQHYAWRTGLHYCLIMVPAESYFQYFFVGTIQSWQSPFFWTGVLRYFLTGAFIAYLNWGSMESRYNNARLGPRSIPQ
jgi:hypothetical protein